MEFDVIIGLEIHVQMKTVSKMFSSAPVSHNDLPNTNTDLLDFAFPGTMPSINKQAVINGLRVADALHMDIDNVLLFERKNYYYSDLPKGYQLTQQFRPLGKNGYLIIKTSSGEKRIGVDRLHLEEDTCKQIHTSNLTYLDFNRTGIPLIEIVTKPDIKNEKEAALFLEKIRSIVSFLGVSDARMEKGSLRCDINISLKESGSSKLGTKVEIKNLNSISNIQKAIEFEINRQKSLIENGKKIRQETRRFDEDKKETVKMRLKNDAVDYKFFTDPNLPPVVLSDEFIKNALETSPELAETKLQRYLSLGLNEYDASLLLNSKEISDYFDKVLLTGANQKLAANWINVDVQSFLNKENISINEFIITPDNLGTLIKLIEQEKISNKQAKELFKEMVKSNKNPNELVKELGMIQMNDERELLIIINELLDHYPQLVVDYKNGKDRVLGFLISQVMQKTEGKANPRLTSRLLIREMKGR